MSRVKHLFAVVLAALMLCLLVCWVYQPHRPEKPLPQPQDKK